jgi:carbamoyl-phosphate synthase large subunit
MKRVLVSGASGIVGYGILRSIRSSRDDCFLVGTSIHSKSVAPAFCDVFELAPSTNSENYLEWLTSTIKKHRIDLLIPGIEIDMYFWVQHIKEITLTGAVPVLNSPDLIALCKDKWLFYQRLIELAPDLAIDSSLDQDFKLNVSKFGLPFLVKPRNGFGSKGISRVSSKMEFDTIRSEVGKTLMVQPIVGTDDDEYTTSAFCDGLGSFHSSMTLRRLLSAEGFTNNAEVVGEDFEFLAALDVLCKAFNPLGPTNFQFRRWNNQLKLLEINPRISSATSIRAAFGFNESVMSIGYFLDNAIPVNQTKRLGRAVRYSEEHIFYQ